MTLMGYFDALRSAVKHRPLLLSIVAGGTRTGGQVILMTFVPIYAIDELGFGAGFVGVLLALLLGLSMVSQPVLAYISDRTNRKWTILPGALILTGVTPFLGVATGAVSLLVLVCILGLFMFSIAILLGALGLDVAPPELHSSVTAAQFIVGLGISSVAPVVAGAVASFGGIESAFYLAAGLFGVTALAVAALPSTKGTMPTPRFTAS